MMANKSLKNIVLSILEDKQAENIKTYDVKGRSPLTDVVVIASANNFRKLDAIINQLRKDFIHHPKYKIHHIEGKPESGWMVMDLYDVVVHLFDPVQREKMNLDDILEHQVKS
ncbi:MAG: ribosome silencing factor [Bacilli bacterium]